MRWPAIATAPARWRGRSGARRLADQEQAARTVASLPLYQVALWPDGWELAEDGSVTVRETHEMAEAQRWYAMARRHGAPQEASSGQAAAKAMRMHGLEVPPGLIALIGRRFASEQVASVAVRLVAGDWVMRRQRRLLQHPIQALALREQTWAGSRYPEIDDAEALQRLLCELFALCVSEELVPETEVSVQVRADDGFGIRGWRCRLCTDLKPHRRAAVQEHLEIALIPWNRQVVSDGRAWALIALRLEHSGGQRRAEGIGTMGLPRLR